MAHKVPNDILIPEIARLVQENKKVCFTPTGNSMRPYIEGGRDSVVLERADSINTGDIVLAKMGDIYVLHRVTEVKGNDITLMGDGNLQGIERTNITDVLAKVTSIRSPKGHKKIIGKGRLWHTLLPMRKILLKVYRKTIVKLFYKE